MSEALLALIILATLFIILSSSYKIVEVNSLIKYIKPCSILMISLHDLLQKIFILSAYRLIR